MILDEFMYTREVALNKLNFNLKPAIHSEKQYSMKKNADCEVFNKFLYLQSEVEKNLIANIPLK